jgi:tetratricopeptide (TPR) repeat protein
MRLTTPASMIRIPPALKSTLEHSVNKCVAILFLSLALSIFGCEQNRNSKIEILLYRVIDPLYVSIDSTTEIVNALTKINQDNRNEYLNAQINILHARIMLEQKPDSARLLMDESDAFFSDNSKYQYTRDHGIALLSQSIARNHLGDFGLSKMAILEARNIFRQLGEKGLERTALVKLGNVNVLTEQFDEAIECYLEVQKNDIEGKAPEDVSIRINLALAYDQTGQHDVALKIIRKGLHPQSTANPPPRGLINLYSILSSIHYNLKHIDSARAYAEKSRDVALKLNFPSEIDMANFRLATLYSNIGQINRANAIASKLLGVQNAAGELSDVPLLLTQNYSRLQKFDSCIMIGSKTLRLQKRLKPTEKSIQLATLVGNAFEKIRKSDSAVFYLQLSSLLKDSVYGPAKQQTMSSLYAEIETVAKQKEIKLLEKQADLNRADNQILLISIAFGLTATMLAISFLTLNYRNRKRKQELMNYELKNQLELRKNELHQQMLRIMYINDGMSEIEVKLRNLKGARPEQVREIQQALNTIHMNRTLEKEWDNFDNYFGSVHVGFFEKINSHFPHLSIMERRLAGLVRMDLSNNQIAGILNIEGNSAKVAKHRLKKKLGLTEEDDLNQFLKSLDDSISVENKAEHLREGL